LQFSDNERNFELQFSGCLLLSTDDARYFQELLKKIENPRIRNAAKEVYIARERLEIGNMLGTGDHICICLKL